MALLARKKMILLFTVVLIICGLSKGEVYKVGDSSGWTNIGHLNYKAWAASKTFQVGDVIVFEYNKLFHNVLRVSHQNFNACNTTLPHSTWATGNDSFVIQRPGHYYFICGIPGHCQAGQKVDIRVPKAHGPTHAPSPLPSGPSQPSHPSGPVPSPPPSGPSPPHNSLGPSPASPSPPSNPSGPDPASPPSSPSSPSPLAPAPAPDHKSGSSSLISSWKLWALVFATVLKALAY